MARRAQPRPTAEPFTLSVLGGAVERRYRHFRPELTSLPWGTLAPDVRRMGKALRARARDYWMEAALNEYRSAGAMADAAAALVAAQAPIDLTSLCARFVLEELNHAELAARILAELGGAQPLAFNSDPFYPPPDPGWSPLLRAGYYVMRVFCTGESYSLPVAQASAAHPSHPMVAAVLRRIAKDEAGHASFGWIFLDWVGERWSRAEHAELTRLARAGMKEIDELISGLGEKDERTFGWLPEGSLKRVLARAAHADVRQPLVARGFDV